MSQINKAVIAPLFAGIFLLLKQTTGIEIGTAEQDIYVNAVLSGITLAGVFMQFRKGGQ